MHLKFGIQYFYNKIMTLIFMYMYNAADIKWLPFVLSFLSIFYVWFVAFGCYCTFFRAKVPVKLNAPDGLLST